MALGFIPSPTSDFFIGIEAFFLALSFLVVGRGGATYTGLVAGLLITTTKFAFFPDDLLLGPSFGAVIDLLGVALKVKSGNKANTARLTADLTISTGAVGFAAFYITVVLTKELVNNTGLDATIIFFGIVSGLIAGFAAARVWNKYLSARV